MNEFSVLVCIHGDRRILRDHGAVRGKPWVVRVQPRNTLYHYRCGRATRSSSIAKGRVHIVHASRPPLCGCQQRSNAASDSPGEGHATHKLGATVGPQIGVGLEYTWDM